MIVCMYFVPLLYEKSDACFPNFGTAQTLYRMDDVYTSSDLF